MKKSRSISKTVPQKSISLIKKELKKYNYFADITTSLKLIEKDFAPLVLNKKLEIISIVGDRVRADNPIPSDIEVWKKAIAKGKVNPKEDFSLKNEGEENELGIKRTGGISPEYRRRVDNRAEFNHWKGYYYLLKEYQYTEKVKDFNFHLPYVLKYAYTLQPRKAIKYLALINYLLAKENIEDKDNYPDTMVEYINNEINKEIERFEKLLEIYKEENEARNNQDESRGHYSEYDDNTKRNIGEIETAKID